MRQVLAHALLIAAAWVAIDAVPAQSQIIADSQTDLTVRAPAFARDAGPIVAVDSGHNNYHTIQDRYAPFAGLLRNDGFHVIDSPSPFTAPALARENVLVIANARPPTGASPGASAFSAKEIDTVKAWVLDGGSLLLIADHEPFAGSARNLALAFGFRFQDGVVERDPIDRRPDIFSISDGTLANDVVTRGRSPAEAVTSIRTFTGSAFQAPPGARPIITLPAGFMVHDCGLPCPAGVPERDVGGYLQGAVLPFGKGRVAVVGEAAMFSAQVMTTTTPPFKFGFNAPGAEQNKQFILNLAHWLGGLLPVGKPPA